jgi:uncharacterized protein (UPF0335 family)
MPDLNVSEELVLEKMDQLTGLIDEADELATRKKEWRADCKNAGLDAKIIEKVVKMKRADPDKIAEEEAITDTYKRVAGLE